MVTAARQTGFGAVHRLYVLESISGDNIDTQVAQSQPDIVAILPGCMPKGLGWITERISQPIIAGGLVCDEEDAQLALAAGALAVSTTNAGVWPLAQRR